MARYIKAEDAENLIAQLDSCFAAYVDDIPTADVQPVVHGKTIVDDFSIPKCSICGGTVCCNEYCCHCGAKLDEVKNNVC